MLSKFTEEALSFNAPEKIDKSLSNKFLGSIITMVNDSVSTAAARNVIMSIRNTKSEIFPFIIPATTPETLEEELKEMGLSMDRWTYPSEPGQVVRDLQSGMTLSGYNAKHISKVVSCLVSHMRIWYMCAGFHMPIVVMEHDAKFTKKFVSSQFPKTGGGIIGLNDPRGATRKSSVYYTEVLNSKSIYEGYPNLREVPWVDSDQTIPQGIAGNSAYIIYPKAAGHMLDLVRRYGMWPNDALMCKQLVPFLKQAYPFLTTLQGVRSTTQG